VLVNGCEVIVQHIIINQPMQQPQVATITPTPTQAQLVCPCPATAPPTDTPEPPADTPTVAPTDTPELATAIPTDTPELPTPTPLPPERCTVVANALNLRSGPGTNFEPVRTLTAGLQLIPLARNPDNTWIEVMVDGTTDRGWVSAGRQYVVCGEDTTVTPPAPTPTIGSTPTVGPPAPVNSSSTSACPGLIYDFEDGTGWRRGDQTWGELTFSNQQVYSGQLAGQLEYNIPANATDNFFVYYRIGSPLPIPGQPNAIRLQVYGDGSGNLLNAWIEDAQGQRWQFTFGQINHTGWQEMIAPLDPGRGWPNGPIGSVSTELPVYPLRFYAFVVDQPGTAASIGILFLDEVCTAEVLPTSTPAPISPTEGPQPTSVSSPAPSPASTETAQPICQPPSISFEAESTSLEAGDCTELNWDVQNIWEVYLDDEGVTGQGSEEVCPSSTQTYVLDIVLCGGGQEDRSITIEVDPGSICGQFIWLGNREYPGFLPEGSNEPWRIDSDIEDIFSEGAYARIVEPDFYSDEGANWGYPNVKHLGDYSDVTPVSDC
jgi:hypothetical protein